MTKYFETFKNRYGGFWPYMAVIVLACAVLGAVNLTIFFAGGGVFCLFIAVLDVIVVVWNVFIVWDRTE